MLSYISFCYTNFPAIDTSFFFSISNPISLRSTDGCNKKIYNLARETFKGKEEHKNKKFQEIRKSEQLRATIQT
jgi:hypothetical protein